MVHLSRTLASPRRFEFLETFESNVLELSREVLGQEHLNNLAAMSSLAVTYRVVGRLGDAELLQSSAFDIYEKTSREAHPDPITVGVNRTIVWAYQEACARQGLFIEIDIEQIEILPLRVHILDNVHPDTISSHVDIARTQSGLGRFAEAEKAQVKVLERRRNILGCFHPDTIGDMEQLADTWYKQDKIFESGRLLTDAVRLYERSLCVQHPDTIKA